MIVLDKNDFAALKQSNTIIVYGSGFSINDITKGEWNKLSKFDSIGFNWFCKSNKPTTFYVLREQCISKNKRVKNERVKDIYGPIKSDTYKDSCLIVHKLSYSESVKTSKRYKLHDHSDYIDEFSQKGIVVNDIVRRTSKISANPKKVVKNFKMDIFDFGVEHGLCSLYGVMHICKYLDYERILFVGIDLYDSRYFWLPKNASRVNKIPQNKHPIGKFTLDLMKNFRKTYSDIQLYTYNQKSLLRKVMKIWPK